MRSRLPPLLLSTRPQCNSDRLPSTLPLCKLDSGWSAATCMCSLKTLFRSLAMLSCLKTLPIFWSSEVIGRSGQCKDCSRMAFNLCTSRLHSVQRQFPNFKYRLYSSLQRSCLMHLLYRGYCKQLQISISLLAYSSGSQDFQNKK